MTRHVGLYVSGSTGTQPVPAEVLGPDTSRATATPGLVLGLAAGDVFRLIDSVSGAFEVIERGGNLGLQIFSDGPIDAAARWLGPRIEALGGWCDGQVETAVVFTVPLRAGFEAVEALMRECGERFALEWGYSNVYDEQGGPLAWWQGSPD